MSAALTERVVRDDLGCVIEYSAESHALNFRVVEIAAWPMEPGGGYEYMNDDCEFVDDPALASNYISGFIKWDGCSHLNFGERENPGYIHLCGRGAFDRMRGALDAVWRLAAENVSGWNASVASPAPTPPV